MRVIVRVRVSTWMWRVTSMPTVATQEEWGRRERCREEGSTTDTSALGTFTLGGGGGEGGG